MKPRLLDLFCGAGGCSVGYARAGFDVTGVDIEAHPDYPFPMIVGDAMELLDFRPFLRTFDVIHASPPCQGYSTATADHSRHPRLIGPVRDRLRRAAQPYVIENVDGARGYMQHPIRLCGSSFGLRVRRHRLFESNMFLSPLPCAHSTDAPVGVYGDHPDPRPYTRPSGSSRGVKATSLEDAQDAMGIDWMTDWDDLTDAIPPHFTQFIGEQLIDQLAAVACNEDAVRIALDAGAKSVRLRKAEAELTRLRAAVQTMADNSQTPPFVRDALLRALNEGHE